MYIYLTINKINGKKYIGQHKGEPNDSYLGSGTLLKRAIDKYGKENFEKEIICLCSSQEELDEKEKYYIKLYDAVNSEEFYNIAEGGLGGNPCLGLTKEQELERRNKISKAMSGEGNPNFGKTFKKEEHNRYGKLHTEDSKEKMRLAKLGKSLSEEHKKKISLNSTNSTSIDMYSLTGEFLKTFRTKREVNCYLGLNPNSTFRLSNAIKENKPYHNFIFKLHIDEPVSTIHETVE